MSSRSDKRPSNQEGFTLLELIVVLAGLGILTSLALPNVIDILDSNNVDEIKTLLNSAAADCLQKKRSEDDPIIDDEIISDQIIKKLGYKIDQESTIFDEQDMPKCSNFLLKPIEDEDNVRYNIGFSLLGNGKLDKLASTDNKNLEPDCIRWAGKCSISPCGKILGDYKNSIRSASEICSERFKEWKKTMNPEKYEQWNSNKGPDTCPLIPPPNRNDDSCDTSYQGTNSCTTDGCDRPVWGLWNDETNKGTTYSTESAYKAAREILVGEKCAKQIKEEYESANPPFTNPDSNPELLSECKYDPYWFIDGKSQGTKEKWEEGMCQKNKQDISSKTFSGPVKYCKVSPVYIIDGEEINPDGSREKAEEEYNERIENDKELTCSNLLRDDAKTKSDAGPHISPTPSDMKPIIPDDCGAKYWYCKDTGKIYRTEEKYNSEADDSCKTKTCKPPDVNCAKKKNRGSRACIDYVYCLQNL